MNKYEAIIFDLDGTLLDTLEDLRDSVNYVMKQKGYPEHSLEAIRSFVGNGIRNLMIHAVPQGEENPEFEDAFSMFIAYYLEHNQIKTKPYEGIMELLKELQQRKVPMAIVSYKNQPSVDMLAKEVFCGCIPVALGDSPERKRKPAPDGVQEAIRRLGLAEDARVLYVGDSEVDAKTAENAKLDCVLCAWGFREEAMLETLPHVALIHKPEEVLAFVE